jgi:hypothetical protein
MVHRPFETGRVTPGAARALRTQHDPLQIASHWRPALQDGILTLLAPHRTIDQDAQHIDPQQRDTETSKQEPALSLTPITVNVAVERASEI